MFIPNFDNFVYVAGNDLDIEELIDHFVTFYVGGKQNHNRCVIK